MEHSSHDLLELMRRCTVRVSQGVGMARGSCRHQILLTCAHVVEAAHTHASPVEVCWEQRGWRADCDFLATLILTWRCYTSRMYRTTLASTCTEMSMLHDLLLWPSR